MVTDRIADMLTRIRNANMLKHDIVEVPKTKMSIAIAEILDIEGYIQTFEKYDDSLLISLKYHGQNREPVITHLERVSRPGLRIYNKSETIAKVLGGLGISIVSTSSGVMTGKDAKSRGIGGEILCYIW